MAMNNAILTIISAFDGGGTAAAAGLWDVSHYPAGSGVFHDVALTGITVPFLQDGFLFNASTGWGTRTDTWALLPVSGVYPSVALTPLDAALHAYDATTLETLLASLTVNAFQWESNPATSPGLATFTLTNIYLDIGFDTGLVVRCRPRGNSIIPALNAPDYGVWSAAALPAVSVATHWGGGTYGFNPAFVRFAGFEVVAILSGGDWLLINEPSLGLISRSNYLDENNPASFTLQQGSRSTASIPLVIHAGDDYAATLGAPVYLYEFVEGGSSAGVCVFAGTIDTIEITWDGDRGDRRAVLNCVSLEQVFDVLIVPTVSHFGQTTDFIVHWLLENYCQDAPVIVGTIDAGPVIPEFTLDFESVSGVFDRLAVIAGTIWGVNPVASEFSFRAPDAVASPFTLASNQVLWETMDWQWNRQDFRNKQSLRIAFEAFFPQYVSFPGNGIQTIFTLPFRIDKLTFTALTTSTQNTGTATFTAQPVDGDTALLNTRTYTFKNVLDNRIPWQIQIAATLPGTIQNFCDAINGNPAPGTPGVAYSLPTWANDALTADAPLGLTLTVRSGYAGAGSNPLATTSAGFTWSGATTSGGATGASTALSFVVISADAAASDVYYTVGNENVNCAVAPPAGKNLLVGYYRQGADVISVEDTALVTARAAIEHSTGRYQAITDDSQQLDAAAALTQVQATLADWSSLPVTFQFTTDIPGLSTGQTLSIILVSPTGTPSLINGDYLIQEVNGDLIPGIQYIGAGKGHYRYTVHVVSATVGTYAQFWKQLASGSGSGSGSSSGTSGGGGTPLPADIVTTDAGIKTPGRVVVWTGSGNVVEDPGGVLSGGLQTEDGFVTLSESPTAIWAPNGTAGGAHVAATETIDLAGLATTDAPALSGSGSESEYYDSTLDAVMESTNGAAWRIRSAVRPGDLLAIPIYIGASLIGSPTVGQTVALLGLPIAGLFAANFSGSVGSVGTNPTATALYTVKKNGSTIGTISISTGGVLTFATSGGTTQSYAANDRLTIIAPSPVDAALSDVEFILKGTRT